MGDSCGVERPGTREPASPVSKRVWPLFVRQIRCDDCGFSLVTLLDELEEDTALFRTQIEIGQFTNDENVQAREPVEEASGGAVCERGIHLVEEILRPDEAAADLLQMEVGEELVEFFIHDHPGKGNCRCQCV